jgi:hypothetical protein
VNHDVGKAVNILLLAGNQNQWNVELCLEHVMTLGADRHRAVSPGTIRTFYYFLAQLLVARLVGCPALVRGMRREITHRSPSIEFTMGRRISPF